MKTTFKKISIVFITCLIMICIINKLSFVVRPLETDDAYSQVETFHSLPENSLEVIAYGSSHTFKGLNSIEMYKKYGIGIYNYSWNWQKMITTKLFIEDSLLSQKPKVILIDTYLVNRNYKNSGLSAEIYYSRYVKNKGALVSYLINCFGYNIQSYIEYCFPLLTFHDNWNSLTSESFNDISINPTYFEEMGFYPNETITATEISNTSGVDENELEDYAIDTLNSIVDICDKNNIKVVFCTIPYSGVYNYGKAMKDYAEKNNCDYINLFEHIEEIGLDGNTDFADEGHLNTNGSIKVADYLGQYLKNNYVLTDMREIDNNIWEKAIN